MATTGSIGSQSTSTANLDSIYVTQINSIMTSEKRPVDRLTKQKDSLTVQKSAYTDMKAKLDAFQAKVRALLSTDSSYALSTTRSATVSGAPTGSSVLTASASSSALAATYTVQVTQLARQMTTRSDKQPSSTDALNYSGAFTLNGQNFTVSTGQSLNDIVTMINGGTYTVGQEVLASVVDNRLVVQSKNSGGTPGAAITASGDVLKHTGGLGMLEDDGTTWRNYSAAEDENRTAQFKINGTSVERNSNTNLTDVLSGVTLNLAADAAGKSTILTVANDTSTAKNAINSFISEYNTLLTYIKDRTAVVKNDDGTFTRGSLSGDSIFRGLRLDLAGGLFTDITNSGSLLNLSQIGLGTDSSGNLAVTDATKLDSALTSNSSDVKNLLDGAMLKYDNKVAMFTGDTGYVKQSMNTADTQLSTIKLRSDSMTTRLNKRRSQLIDQYTQYQTLLNNMVNQQSYLKALFSGQA